MKVALLVLFAIFVGVVVGDYKQTYWTQKGRADPQETVSFRLALKQQNLDVLEATLLDVSNPKSENYGAHWSIDAILDLVAPSHEVSEAVVDFVKGQGVAVAENQRDVIKCEATVEVIEKLFQNSLYYFTHSTKQFQIVRAVGEYTMPNALVDVVDFVGGLYEFPQIRRPKTSSPSADPQAKKLGYVIPQLIQNLYNLPQEYKVSTNSSIGLAEFQDDKSFSKADMASFSTGMGLNFPIDVTHIVGPYQPGQPDAESTLDVEYGASIALNNTVWFWTVKGWMFEFATDLFGAAQAPYIVSMSWGWPEPNQCDVAKCTDGETSVQYVSRVNTEFQKIGLRGITLLAASGDQGAPGDSNPYCNNHKVPLSTIFPGASPWVLSVGATMLTPNGPNTDFNKPPICKQYRCANVTNEAVCTYPTALITTGGGFSNYVPRPTWQDTVVSAYLSSGVALPPAKYFNNSNRGFPDVSALGHNYLIAISDDWEGVDGTSCSSPVFAGLVALLNDWRLLNGKTTLGFINQVIYSAYAADSTTFTDIVGGNNKCTEQCCSDYGYVATKGWDPLTGLGTPNFPSLLKYVQTLN